MYHESMIITVFAPDFFVDQMPGPGYDPTSSVRVPATLHLHNNTEHRIELAGTGAVAWRLATADTAESIAVGVASVPEQVLVGVGDTHALEFFVDAARGAFRRGGSYRLEVTYFAKVETRVDVTITQ